MRPIAAQYYLTYNCNDRCEFCGMWRDSEHRVERESDLNEIKGILAQLKSLGIAYLDLTGGEPLLKDDLPEILKFSREIGLTTGLTTNCILFPERGREIAGNVDRLVFSLDFPTAEEHDRIRGVASFERVMESIELARSLGASPIINFTATRESVRFLPEMVDVARENKLLLWINPVYDFEGLHGFDPETISHIKYYGWNPNVEFNLAALEFMKTFGNRRERPRCRAASSTVTISPDGHLIIPCFKNSKGKVKIEGSIKETLEKSGDAASSQGRLDICDGCMMWPYMIPSFFYKVDKFFVLNIWSLIRLYWKEYRIKKGEKQ